MSAASAVALLVAWPAVVLARAPRGGGIGVSGGGATGTTTTGTTTTGTGTTPGVTTLTGIVRTRGHGITLTVAASGIQGHPLTFTGTAPRRDHGAEIQIESSNVGRTRWSVVATAQITTIGRFAAKWRPSTSAQTRLRAVLARVVATPGGSATGGGGLPTVGSTGTATGTSTAIQTGTSTTNATKVPTSASPTSIATRPLTIPIFRNGKATMYGPGFWGNHTACGEILHHGTLGVASPNLPCGTLVEIYYRGREITVPVIDTGPFRNGVRWDLTWATGTALGITATSIIETLTPAPPAHS